MQASGIEKTTLKKNVIVNILDGGFFGFGLGFASFTTFIPLFLSKFTDSPLLFSLIPAIHGLGWQLPQLFAVKSLNKLSRFKPVVLLMSLHERLPFIGFAVIALFMNKIPAMLGIILFFLIFLWQSLGAGFTANAWQNMIAKIIPATNLGAFFGIQSAAANLLASIGSILAGYILAANDASAGFFICFSLTVIGMTISYFFLSLTKEREKVIPPKSFTKTSLLKQVRRILVTNKEFVKFFISRSIFQIATMGSAFYIVYWVNSISILNEKTAGIITGVLTISQMIGAPAFGWLADQWGHRNVYVLGAISALLSSALAILSSVTILHMDPIIWAFVAMALIGISQSILWTVGLSYSLTFGSEEEKPLYVGIINTLGAPISVIVPIIGGIVASKTNYPTTFFLSMIAAFATLIVLLFTKYKKVND